MQIGAIIDASDLNPVGKWLIKCIVNPDLSGTATQLCHASKGYLNIHETQDRRHLHQVVPTPGDQLQFNTKMQMSLWPRGRGDQGEAGYFPITEFKATEAMRGTEGRML